MASRKYMNARYVSHEYDDETSQYDPKGKWCPGGEYYSRRFKCRVPKGLVGKLDELWTWIENHQEDDIWEDA